MNIYQFERNQTNPKRQDILNKDHKYFFYLPKLFKHIQVFQQCQQLRKMSKEKPDPTIYQKAVQAIQLIVKRTKPKSSSCIKSCVVALFTSTPTNHTDSYYLMYTSKIGILQLDTDRKLNCKMLRLYDLETVELLFQFELYSGFMDYYKIYGSKELQIENLYIFQVPSISANAINQVKLPQRPIKSQKILSMEDINFQNLILYEMNKNKVYERLIGFLFKNSTQAYEMQQSIQKNCPKSKQINCKEKEKFSSALKYIGTEQSIQKVMLCNDMQNPSRNISRDLNKGTLQQLKQLCQRNWGIGEEAFQDPQTTRIIICQLIKSNLTSQKDSAIIKKIQEYQKKQELSMIKQNKKYKINHTENNNQQQGNHTNFNQTKKNGKQQKIVSLHQISPSKMRRIPAQPQQTLHENLTPQFTENKLTREQNCGNRNIINIDVSKQEQKIAKKTKKLQFKQNLSEISQQSSLSFLTNDTNQMNLQEQKLLLDDDQNFVMNINQFFFRQICDNKIIQTNGLGKNGQIQLKIDNQELKKKEFGQNLKKILNNRKLALRRRQASDQQNEEEQEKQQQECSAKGLHH